MGGHSTCNRRRQLSYHPSAGVDAEPVLEGRQAFTRGLEGPDQTKMVSARIAADLQPNDIVLLDGMEVQAREIPYWLGRTNGIGFISAMEPADLVELLQETGNRQVAFIAFRYAMILDQLKGERWREAWTLLTSMFEPIAVPDAPDWTVYQRRAVIAN